MTNGSFLIAFALVLLWLFGAWLMADAGKRASRKPEAKPPFDTRPCHVKLWMVDNNTVEFDGPGTAMADLLADAKGDIAFTVDTKDARILINPRHVIQGRLVVAKETP